MFLKPKRPISPVHRVPHYSFKTDIFRVIGTREVKRLKCEAMSWNQAEDDAATNEVHENAFRNHLHSGGMTKHL